VALELASREPGLDMYDSRAAMCATHIRIRSGARTTRNRTEPRSTGETIPPPKPLSWVGPHNWHSATMHQGKYYVRSKLAGRNPPKASGVSNPRRRVGRADKPTGGKMNTHSQYPSTWYPTQSTARGPRSSPVRPCPDPAGVALAAPNSARTSSRPVTRTSRSW
jgi:hypothetical protein